MATISAAQPAPGRSGIVVAQPANPHAGRIAAARQAHRETLGNAAATRDTFLDIIVLLSVLMFLALAIGVGMLVLGPTVHWPR